MTELHSIVCLKVVPKSEEVTIDPEARTLDRSKARSEINSPDMNALEAALALKARHGGRISLLSMGPPLFERFLRVGLAMGADSAYLMSDRAFGGADTLATSYTLAEGIKAIGEFDIVFCGDESSDGATGQVPPGIAEWLDIPQVTYANRVQLVAGSGSLRARRDLGHGNEVVEAPLPCVVSIRQDGNEPRFLDFQRYEWAMHDAPVTVWTLSELKLDESLIGTAGSPTTVAGVDIARSAERRHEFLEGSPEEKVAALLEKIRPWVRVE
jgi:electron transfer flavoprotein beta subunit